MRLEMLRPGLAVLVCGDCRGLEVQVAGNALRPGDQSALGRRVGPDGRMLTGEVLLHAATGEQVAEEPQLALLDPTGRFVLWTENERTRGAIFQH